MTEVSLFCYKKIVSYEKIGKNPKGGNKILLCQGNLLILRADYIQF